MLITASQQLYGGLAVLHPFQRYFSHRLYESNNGGTLFTAGKISSLQGKSNQGQLDKQGCLSNIGIARSKQTGQA